MQSLKARTPGGLVGFVSGTHPQAIRGGVQDLAVTAFVPPGRKATNKMSVEEMDFDPAATLQLLEAGTHIPLGLDGGNKLQLLAFDPPSPVPGRWNYVHLELSDGIAVRALQDYLQDKQPNPTYIRGAVNATDLHLWVPLTDGQVKVFSRTYTLQSQKFDSVRDAAEFFGSGHILLDQDPEGAYVYLRISPPVPLIDPATSLTSTMADSLGEIDPNTSPLKRGPRRRGDQEDSERDWEVEANKPTTPIAQKSAPAPSVGSLREPGKGSYVGNIEAEPRNWCMVLPETRNDSKPSEIQGLFILQKASVGPHIKAPQHDKFKKAAPPRSGVRPASREEPESPLRIRSSNPQPLAKGSPGSYPGLEPLGEVSHERARSQSPPSPLVIKTRPPAGFQRAVAPTPPKAPAPSPPFSSPSRPSGSRPGSGYSRPTTRERLPAAARAAEPPADQMEAHSAAPYKPKWEEDMLAGFPTDPTPPRPTNGTRVRASPRDPLSEGPTRTPPKSYGDSSPGRTTSTGGSTGGYRSPVAAVRSQETTSRMFSPPSISPIYRGSPPGSPRDASQITSRSVSPFGQRVNDATVRFTDIPNEEHKIRSLFRHLDRNLNGYLTKAQFKDFFEQVETYGIEYTPEMMDDMLSNLNLAGSDNLSYEEFALLCCKLANQ